MTTTKKPQTFNEFVSGDGLLNFALSVGVFLLIVTYGGIMYRINPQRVWLWYDVMVATVEAFFFGLATFLVIRQAQDGRIKFIYAGFEGVALFLYYNSKYFGVWADFALTSYISVFGAFTFYALGAISLHRYKEQLAAAGEGLNKKVRQVSANILDKTGEPYTQVGFQLTNTAKKEVKKGGLKQVSKPVQSPLKASESEVMRLIADGVSYSKISELTGYSKGNISRIKSKNT